jgi:hypothetical protein
LFSFALQVLNTENEEPVPVTNAKKRKAAAQESKSKSNKSGKKRKAASCESERAPKVQNGANRKSTKNKVVQEEEEDASGYNADDGEPSKGDISGVGDSEDEETERKKVSKVMHIMQVVVLFSDPKNSAGYLVISKNVIDQQRN